jgi:hypothetical protein
MAVLIDRVYNLVLIESVAAFCDGVIQSSSLGNWDKAAVRRENLPQTCPILSARTAYRVVDGFKQIQERGRGGARRSGLGVCGCRDCGDESCRSQ